LWNALGFLGGGGENIEIRERGKRKACVDRMKDEKKELRSGVGAGRGHKVMPKKLLLNDTRGEREAKGTKSTSRNGEKNTKKLILTI